MPASIQVVVVALLLVNFAFASQAVMERYSDAACTKKFGTFAAATTCLPGEPDEKVNGIHSRHINCAAGTVSQFSDDACGVKLNTGWDFVVGRCQQQKDSTTFWIKITSCDDSATLAPVTTGGFCAETHANADCSGDIVQYGCVGTADESCFQVGNAGFKISCANKNIRGFADTACSGTALVDSALNTTVGHCWDHGKTYSCGAPFSAGSSASGPALFFISFIALAVIAMF